MVAEIQFNRTAETAMQIMLDRPPNSKSGEPFTTVAPSQLAIRFWGVRGGIACPDPQTAKYGGNTACVEVRFGDKLLIFDGGTGIRRLGEMLMASGSPLNADIFYSHFHMDHVCGLPFFTPCYIPTSRLRLWGGSLRLGQTTKQALSAMMADPLFPVGLDEFKAKIEYCDFRAGETLEPHTNATLRTAPLNHPGGCTGYRLDFGEKAIAYVTDTEHTPGVLDENVLDLIDGADVLIYDANYTDDEFSKHIGWGHSTWQEGVRLADAADVNTLVLFHHDPQHHDDILDRIGAEVEARRPGTIVGREGLEIHV
jgi:phosphoribosyl 1,2-cyclic phosphodiesterase